MGSRSLCSVLVLVLTAGLFGCGGGSSNNSDSDVLTVGFYAGTAHSLPEKTVSLMTEAGIRLVSLDPNLYMVNASGASTNQYPDVLLLIARDPKDGFEEGVRPTDLPASPVLAAVKSVYQAVSDARSGPGHIIVLNPTREVVTTLSGVLGETFDILPSGDTQLLFYGVTRSPGRVSTIGHIDSSSVKVSCCTSDEEGDTAGASAPEPRERVDDYIALRKWVKETSSPLTIAAGTDDSKNLLKMAQTYVATLSSNLWGKSFKINNYVVAVHNFSGAASTGGKDWFYLHQENILDGSGGYVFDFESFNWVSRVNGNKYWVGGAECVDSYIEGIQVGNTLQNISESSVVLTEPSPTAINAEVSHSTSTSHSFGLDVSGGYISGKDKSGVSLMAGLAYGYNCTDSKTFTTRDVNASLNTTNRVAWTYTYKGSERGKPWRTLTQPAELSHSTYTPHHMWIWSYDTAQRTQHQSYQVGLNPTHAGVYSRNSGSIKPAHVTASGSMTLDITLPVPPLLALEVDALTFDRDGKETNGSKSYANYDVQGFASAQANVGWFKASLVAADNKKQVAITGVQPNTTGNLRTGIVTLKRVDAGDSVALTINQLP